MYTIFRQSVGSEVGIKVKRTCRPFDRGFMHPILRECNAVFRTQCLVNESLFDRVQKRGYLGVYGQPPIIPCN